MDGQIEGEYYDPTAESFYDALCNVYPTRARQNMYISCKLVVVSQTPLDTLAEKQLATLGIREYYMSQRSWQAIFKFACAINTARLTLVSQENDRYYYMAKIAGNVRFYSETTCPEDHKHVSFNSVDWPGFMNNEVFIDFFAYHTEALGSNINQFFTEKLVSLGRIPSYYEVFHKYRIIISKRNTLEGIAIMNRLGWE